MPPFESEAMVGLTFHEQPIKDSHGNNEIVGWHSTCFSGDKPLPLSGGTSADRATARKIAISEYFERRAFRKLKENNSKDLFLDLFPSTAGFACGGSRTKVKWRAICEGLERWGISKWIDDKFLIPKLDESRDSIIVSPLGRALSKPFSRLHFFQKAFTFHNPIEFFELKEALKQKSSNVPLMFYLRIFIGETDQGVFCGSRVNPELETPWEHEIIEANRNFSNFGQILEGQIEVPKENWFLNRVHYFGLHKSKAFSQIEKATKLNWEMPRLLILKEIPMEQRGLYLWRCLFQDFKNWGDGPIDRFVI